MFFLNSVFPNKLPFVLNSACLTHHQSWAFNIPVVCPRRGEVNMPHPTKLTNKIILSKTCSGSGEWVHVQSFGNGSGPFHHCLVSQFVLATPYLPYSKEAIYFEDWLFWLPSSLAPSRWRQRFASNHHLTLCR